jgi:NTP pyrophosphatase (non-canonical NTP hydrolase)
MTNFERVMGQIKQERERQNEKWGDQDHTDEMWLAILLEEVGEVAKDLVQTREKGSSDAYLIKKELIHAVAVGVQWLEKL